MTQTFFWKVKRRDGTELDVEYAYYDDCACIEKAWVEHPNGTSTDVDLDDDEREEHEATIMATRYGDDVIRRGEPDER